MDKQVQEKIEKGLAQKFFLVVGMVILK